MSTRLRGRVPLRLLIPNLITILALCSGLTAIRLGFEGRHELAVAAIILAIVLDAMDGRLARYLQGTSRFGAELDSLSDFVNFGVAPGLILYTAALSGLKSIGWGSVLIFVMCCGMRLARFNVALDDPDKPQWKTAFFTGVPAPAGAALALVPMYMHFLGLIDSLPALSRIIAVWLMLTGFLMASRIPTFSGKSISGSIRRDYVLPLLIAAALFVMMLISFTWEVMLGATLAYLLLIPAAWRAWKRKERGL